MKTLNVENAYTLLKISDRSRGTLPLTDQVAPYLGQSPNLILDLGGIQLTSMLIGELLNVHRGFEEQWESHAHRISLVNLTPTSRDVLQRVRLTDYLTICDTLEQATNGRRKR